MKDNCGTLDACELRRSELVHAHLPTTLLEVEGPLVVVLGVKVLVGVKVMLLVITSIVEVKVGVRRVVAVTMVEETLIVYLEDGQSQILVRNI